MGMELFEHMLKGIWGQCPSPSPVWWMAYNRFAPCPWVFRFADDILVVVLARWCDMRWYEPGQTRIWDACDETLIQLISTQLFNWLALNWVWLRLRQPWRNDNIQVTERCTCLRAPSFSFFFSLFFHQCFIITIIILISFKVSLEAFWDLMSTGGGIFRS